MNSVTQKSYTAAILSTRGMSVDSRHRMIDFSEYSDSLGSHPIKEIDIYGLSRLKSLRGIPSVISGNEISIVRCKDLIHLDVQVHSVSDAGLNVTIEGCTALKSLTNFPSIVDEDGTTHANNVTLVQLPMVTSLYGIPSQLQMLSIENVGLTTLADFPRLVREQIIMRQISIENFDGLNHGTKCRTLIISDIKSLRTFSEIHAKFDELSQFIVGIDRAQAPLTGMLDLAQLAVRLGTMVTFIVPHQGDDSWSCDASRLDELGIGANFSPKHYAQLLRKFTNIINSSAPARMKLLRVTRLFNERSVAALM
mgnify:CR=1 FL=1